MNISTIPNYSHSNIQFKSARYSDYLDDIESVYEDEIIPEYESNNDYSSEITKSSFRDDELWDRQRDKWSETDRFYSIYDLPLADNLVYSSKLSRDDLNIRSRYTESYDIISEKNDMYIPPNIIYTSENAHKNKHESIQERINQGFKKEDIIKIYNNSLVTKQGHKVLDFNLTKRGFDMLKQNRPIEEVTKIISGSKVLYADGSVIFDKDLFNFLSAYPDSRKLVIEDRSVQGDDKIRYELLRKDIMDSIADIKSVCKNENEIHHLIRACEVKRNNKKTIDKNVLNICLDSIKEGASTIYVAKAINKSKIEEDFKNEHFNKDLFNFFIQYPVEKSKVVNVKGIREVIRDDIIDAYPLIDKTCKHNQNKIDKVIKTCEIGTYANKVIDGDCLKVCIDEINNGRSLNDIEEDIEYSKIHKSNAVFFDKDFYYFLKKYPEGRSVVINKAFRNEVLNKDKMNAYSEIADLCNDIDDISSVLRVCTVPHYENKRVDMHLIVFAKELLKKDNDWRQEHNNLINSVKVITSRRYTLIDEQKINEAIEILKKPDTKISDVHSLFIKKNN